MNKENDSLIYEIAITLIPLVGDIVGKKLISYCGSAEAVFKESSGNLRKIPGIGSSIISAIKSSKTLNRANEEIEFIKKFGISPLYYLSSAYPARLKNCIDSPIMLYYKGNADLNHSRIISIVGTRRPSIYGKRIVRKLVDDICKYNVLVVSGLAYGIDSLAHKHSLLNNTKTIAVLGHGLDRVYPQVNRRMAKQIIGMGGLLSDFMSKTKPDYINFPKRNRIVAGMSDAVIVIESAKKGGALITADIANSYNKDVFAVPGNLNENYSEGCNYLIRSNKAALFYSVEDFVFMMGWDEKPNHSAVQKQLFIDLLPEEQTVINVLKNNISAGIDRISIETQMNMTTLSSVLLQLELKGIITCLPGKVYKLI